MDPSRRRVIVALALVVATAFGCNAIVGISDYERAECSGGGPCDDGGVLEVPDALGPKEGGHEAGPVEPGAAPVSWASWRMPNYVGADAGNDPILGVVESTVVDSITKLTWRRAVETTQIVTFEQADARCRDIEPKGMWRLPKRIELVTLLDYSRKGPTIDTTKFANFPSIRVWTSSEARPIVAGAERSYWTVDFTDGVVQPISGGPSPAATTLCVKGK